ncbi:MAG: PepSY-like domain-containing protein, partial [Alistipes sp.]|nr:PepSY-like domain-containing protein [Alistipes sp.]
KGEWKEVDCKFTEVPAGIVPAPIAEYVVNNYPNTEVVKIEKDSREYEVKLSNRMELTFDRRFNLTDIDY